MLAVTLVTALTIAQTGSALLDPASQEARRSIGTWFDWTAFTSWQAGASVCTLVSRPFSVVPSTGTRSEFALTVTRRPGRGETVALAAGSAGVGAARAELRMGAESFPLDPGPDGAFVRDVAATLEAMRRSLQAVASFEGPQGERTTATYSLRGFRAAYGAARRVCSG